MRVPNRRASGRRHHCGCDITKVSEDRTSQKKEQYASSEGGASSLGMILGKRPSIVRHDTLPSRSRTPSYAPPASVLIKYSIFTLVLLVIMVVAASYVFDRARVRITPYIVEGPVDLVVTASESGATAGVHFETMTLERQLQRTVSADGVTENESRASGTIVIFNKETKEQDFREETRFQSSGGLVYKLAKGGGVRVPAAKNGIPGSLEVTVYADQPGAEYNISESDFVIPGWKEIADPRFETQYARSKTAFTGGETGQVPRISEKVFNETLQDLKKVLQEQLAAQSAVEIPEGFVFFPDTLDISFDQPKIAFVPQSTTEAIITLTARAHAYIFEESTLTQKLVTALVPEKKEKTDTNVQSSEGAEENIKTTHFILREPHTLMMTWSPETERDLIEEEEEEGGKKDLQQIRFRLKGDVALQSFIDTKYLQEQLAGITLQESGALFTSIPEIAKASVSLRPMWKSHFPKKQEHIHIDTQS